LSIAVPLQPNGTPTRVRKPFDLAGLSSSGNCGTHSRQAEIEARLQEIIKLTGIITVDGRKFFSSIHDLENLGELGFGSCGQVVKMRHPSSNAIIAVKVCFITLHSLFALKKVKIDERNLYRLCYLLPVLFL